MRKRVYPNQIYFGKMTQEEADFQIKGIEEIIKDYEGRQTKLL